MKKWTVLIALSTLALFMFFACTNSKTEPLATVSAPAKESFGGFESQVKRWL